MDKPDYNIHSATGTIMFINMGRMNMIIQHYQNFWSHSGHTPADDYYYYYYHTIFPDSSEH